MVDQGNFSPFAKRHQVKIKMNVAMCTLGICIPSVSGLAKFYFVSDAAGKRHPTSDSYCSKRFNKC